MSDDWDLDGPGFIDEPEPDSNRGRARRSSPSTRLYNAWKEAMSETMVVAVNAPRPVFNKHIKDLLERADEESIARAFKRFAADVRSKRVLIKNNAWFTFYGRREKYVASQRHSIDAEQDWEGFKLPEVDW